MNDIIATKRINTYGVKYPSHQEAFAQLTPEQVKIVRTKQISGSKTSEEWLNLFENILIYNKSMSIHHRRLGIWAIGIGIALGVICFIIMPLYSITIASPAPFILTLIMIPFVYYFGNEYLTGVHRQLLIDYFEDIVVRMVVALHEETAPDTPITIHANLRHQLDKRHFVKLVGNASYLYHYYHWKMLKIYTPLHNHAKLHLTVDMKLYKKLNKSKTKRVVLIDLTTQYPKKHYKNIDTAAIDEQMYKVKHKDKNKKHVLNLRSKFKRKDDHFGKYDYKDLKLPMLMNIIRESYLVVR